jgi:hypothetical protein
LNHRDRRIGIARVDDYCRRTLQVRTFVQPLCYRIPGIRVVVVIVRFIVVRQEIVVKKDRVVRTVREKFLCVVNTLRDIQLVTYETFLKPSVTSSIIV